MNTTHDLIIIGGGAGGLVVASVAGQLGLDVLLIEKEPLLGGDCLHYGCVPSKALLKAAKVAQQCRVSSDYGVSTGEVNVDIEAVNRSIRDAIETIQVHDSHERFRSYGVEIINGEARFTDAHTVVVGGVSHKAKRFVIATGSIASIPPIDGIKESGFLTNEDMYSLTMLPESLAILGGGPIGVEMAQAYQRLGSHVMIIEAAGRLLPRSDADLGESLRRVLESEGVRVHCDARVVSIKQERGRKTVELDNGDVIEAEQLLVATGRMPVVEGLDLDAAGVRYTERGIVTDARMRTTQSHIYTCGDVTGLHPFTHVAEQQAGVVLANAVFRIPKKMQYDLIPSVVYTEPECAQAGVMTDTQEKGFRTVRFEMADLDRAVAEHATEGFIKLIVDRRSRLVGASIIGARAGEVLHELTLAIQNRMKLSEISGMIHAYPSYSQVNRRVAGQYYKEVLFSERTKWFVRLINRWLP